MPRKTKPREPAAPIDPPAPAEWERQPKETEKQWAAFVRYRDMPVGERSLRRLAGERTSLVRQFEAWSSRNRWVARCRAWDATIDARARATRLDQVEKMNARQQATGAILMSKILQRVNAIDPGDLPPRALAALMIAAAKIEREALGVASSTTRHSVDAGGDDEGRPVPLLEWLAGRIAGEETGSEDT